MKRRQTNEANAPHARSAAADPAPGSDGGRAGDMGQPSQEALARRAYELYVQRGGEPGRDFEDWLRAEAELRSGRQ